MTADAFEVVPLPARFLALDGYVPGNRFIITVCSVDYWYKGVSSYLVTNSTAVQEYIDGESNGLPIGNKDTCKARYLAHDDKVRE
jgi:hypothetical protein